MAQGSPLRSFSLYQRFTRAETTKLLLMVAQYCASLERLTLWECVPPAIVAAVLTTCRGLTELGMMHFDADNFSLMGAFATNLRTLSIVDIYNNSEGTLDEKISAIAMLSHLRKLEIIGEPCCEFKMAIERIAVSCSQLTDVHLHLLPTVGAVQFAMHCPAMTHFRASLSNAVSPQLLNAITTGWLQLRCLILEHEMSSPEWSDGHESALINLVSQLRWLTQLVCVNGNFPSLCNPVDIAARGISPDVADVTMSALFQPWVTRLSAHALRIVLTRCPLLNEIVYTAAAEPASLRTLAVSHIKDLNFPGERMTTECLDACQRLVSLRIWNVAPGYEYALTGLAQRSPGLRHLAITFTERPNMEFFPALLCHARSLEKLHVETMKHTNEGDSGSDSEETT
jgi:hypothetical protein